MFRIKICGITSVADARLAIDAGADAIGLNFYPASPRYVTPEAAAPIAAAARGDAVVVGVFVNQSPASMTTTAEQVGLDALQLHGDEPPELLAQLPDWPVLRARRLGPGGLAGAISDLAACREAGRAPEGLLVDAPANPGQYGGTGRTLAWDQLVDHAAQLGDTPLILAGGLRPSNVAAAIAAVRPHGVDTASGVESAPGKKDPVLVREFVTAAQAALA